MRERERRRSRTDRDGSQCKGGKDEIIQGVVKTWYGVFEGIRKETVRSKAKLYSVVAGVEMATE